MPPPLPLRVNDTSTGRNDQLPPYYSSQERNNAPDLHQRQRHDFQQFQNGSYPLAPSNFQSQGQSFQPQYIEQNPDHFKQQTPGPIGASFMIDGKPYHASMQTNTIDGVQNQFVTLRQPDGTVSFVNMTTLNVVGALGNTLNMSFQGMNIKGNNIESGSFNTSTTTAYPQFHPGDGYNGPISIPGSVVSQMSGVSNVGGVMQGGSSTFVNGFPVHAMNMETQPNYLAMSNGQDYSFDASRENQRSSLRKTIKRLFR